MFIIVLSDLGLAHTEHHQEIPADSQDRIFQLVHHAFKALKHRDDKDVLAKHLAKIPQNFHSRLHSLIQYGVQVILKFIIIIYISNIFHQVFEGKCTKKKLMHIVNAYYDIVCYFQYILTMFDARRGNEGIENLKIGNFQKCDDPNRKLSYYKKVGKLGRMPQLRTPYEN